MRHAVRALSIAIAVLGGIAASRPTAAAVDPALAGTWKLDFPGATIYFTVRADGAYRVHGPTANPRQAGHLDASGGKFSTTSPVWVDAGTYKVSGDAWMITGKLGTGTWRRIWKPAVKSGAAAGSGLCALLSAEDAARALGAAVISGPDPRGGCRYTSQLNSGHTISVTGLAARRQAWQITRKTPKPAMTTIPAVGEDAYSETLAGGQLVANILNGASQFKITLQLQPEMLNPRDDLPALVALAQAAAPRLGDVGALAANGGMVSGTPPPPAKTGGPGPASNGGWIPGSVAPQKGPKPFKGWPKPNPPN